MKRVFSYFHYELVQFFNLKRVWLFVLSVSLGAVASLAKTTGEYSSWVLKTERAVGGDWCLHLIVSALIGASAFYARSGLEPRHCGLKKYALIVLALLLVSFDELLQSQLPTRTFDFIDWLMNVSGIAYGVCFAAGLSRLKLTSFSVKRVLVSMALK
ncbi:VanZ family protein [Vibrio owensii]|uniref:VanZ family protein n=2 Tax=Vibrio owensii TaxID=696485 RepID=A0AAP9GG14_9VIBR|nr:VanZ family protein [Vibrio owensii]AYO17476.1 VanZ family protein [Vibrio owensii]QGH49618.1 VanZ family protein [Vibrio owensii]